MTARRSWSTRETARSTSSPCDHATGALVTCGWALGAFVPDRDLRTGVRAHGKVRGCQQPSQLRPCVSPCLPGGTARKRGPRTGRRRETSVSWPGNDEVSRSPVTHGMCAGPLRCPWRGYAACGLERRTTHPSHRRGWRSKSPDRESSQRFPFSPGCPRISLQQLVTGPTERHDPRSDRRAAPPSPMRPLVRPADRLAKSVLMAATLAATGLHNPAG